MYKCILVPTDGSPVAQADADAAIDLARACGSEIVALCAGIPEPVLQALLARAPVPVMVLRPEVGGTRVPAYAKAPAMAWPATDPG